MLGQQIGNYRITAVIGQGGMGSVYRAVHDSLGRSAAVKVLLPNISSSRDMVSRFFNEARSAASIQHTGIVEVYDFGFLPNGQAYIIMELLEGESLSSRMRRTPRMPHVRALQIVRSIARALHAAHERGIVHRDIKPDNIYLVPDPEMPTGERVKLLDFGIAKLGGEWTESGLTQTGAVMGTPTYMAPEQCRGAGSVDRRADLYALGCLLYEMLCGAPPFVGGGPGDIIAHHLYFQPRPPREVDPAIAPPLEALVLRLLQKEPAQRPPTAQALVEAIDQLGVPAGGATQPLGLPASAAPPVAVAAPTTLSVASASLDGRGVPAAPRRRRGAIIAGSAVAAAAIAAVIVVVAGGGGGERREPAASGGSAPVVAAVTADAAPEPVPPPPDAAPAQVAPATPDAAEPPPEVPPDAGAQPPDEVAAQAPATTEPRDTRATARDRKRPRPTRPEPKRPEAKQSAAGSSAPPAEDAAALAALPQQLTRAMINRGVYSVLERIRACGAGSAGESVRISVTVSPAGAVTSAAVKDASNPSLGECVASRMRSATFERTRIGGAFSYPITF